MLFSVNSAFDVLRAMIPIDPPDRKLSKIETLQLATKYISHLSQILTPGKYVFNVSLLSIKITKIFIKKKMKTFFFIDNYNIK